MNTTRRRLRAGRKCFCRAPGEATEENTGLPTASLSRQCSNLTRRSTCRSCYSGTSFRAPGCRPHAFRSAPLLLRQLADHVIRALLSVRRDADLMLFEVHLCSSGNLLRPVEALARSLVVAAALQHARAAFAGGDDAHFRADRGALVVVRLAVRAAHRLHLARALPVHQAGRILVLVVRCCPIPPLPFLSN